MNSESAVQKVKATIKSCVSYAQLVVAKRMLIQQVSKGTISVRCGKYLDTLILDQQRVVKK